MTKWQKELQELQSQVVEENTSKLKLQMELDSKDSEIEQLQGKLINMGSETASLSSADNDDTDIYTQGLYFCIFYFNEVFSLLSNKKNSSLYEYRIETRRLVISSQQTKY